MSLLPNLATITVEIPTQDLQDEVPISREARVKRICLQTKTRILLEDAKSGFVVKSVRYKILGKWRDCYTAARLLWFRLTRPCTIHLHDSWLPVLQPLVTTHRDYSVTLTRVQGSKVLQARGSYWDVTKLRSELLARHRNQQSSAGFQSDLPSSHWTQVQAVQALHAIQHELRLNLRLGSQLNGLETLQLLFGAQASIGTEAVSLSRGGNPLAADQDGDVLVTQEPLTASDD